MIYFQHKLLVLIITIQYRQLKRKNTDGAKISKFFLIIFTHTLAVSRKGFYIFFTHIRVSFHARNFEEIFTEGIGFSRTLSKIVSRTVPNFHAQKLKFFHAKVEVFHVQKKNTVLQDRKPQGFWL